MVALVTGAARGIGRAVAQALFQDGFSVAVHYCRSENAAASLAAQLHAHPCANGQAAVPFYADISKKAEVRAMFEAVRERLGPADVLVNNAGIAQQKLFQDITEADWDAMLGVHLSGTFYACQCAAEQMIPRHTGKIINVSSMWGQTGAACEVHYSAAKAGVIGLTKALAKELGPSQITVNCVAPGVVQTDMLTGLSPETLEALSQDTPLGRLGTPRDIAETVRFLASERASFITGQVFGVNGGFVI